MSDYNITDGFGFFIGFCCLVTACVLIFGYLLIDWLFIDHNIHTKKPIKPVIEIKYSSETGKADTTYIYKRP